MVHHITPPEEEIAAKPCPLLSIIIPVYNVKTRDIERCLNSIYTNSLPHDEFEVICVNDCSTEQSGLDAIADFKTDGAHPDNLIVTKTRENVRQGGARNHGMSIAKGEYIQFIDQDDFFTPGFMQTLKKSIEANPGFDIIMHDYTDGNENGDYDPSDGYYTKRNHGNPADGGEFLKQQEVPWAPWNYLYRNEFLVKGLKLRFEEKVRFEDADFVLAVTMNAKRIIFRPEVILVHTISTYQTSAVGNSFDRIIDFTNMFHRVGKVAEKGKECGMEGADQITSHHVFGYTSSIKRYLWRLPYGELKKTVVKYPPSGSAASRSRLLHLAKYNPGVFACMLWTAKPFLHGVYFVYKRILKR